MSNKRTVHEADLNEKENYPPHKRQKHNHNNSDSLNPSLDSDESKQQSDDNKIISLQVGERKYMTRISTLKNSGNGYFSSLFAGNFASNESYNGSFFIDRDGDLFYYILQYLRSGTLIISSNDTNTNTEIFQKLLIEAQFYMINSLVEYIKSKISPNSFQLILPNSKILTDSEQQKLQNILTENEMKYNWKLRKSFSERADSKNMVTNTGWRKKKQPTIILIEDSANNVFAISCNVGIRRFSDLFKNGYACYSPLMNDNPQKGLYFNVRDVQKKIAPMTFLAECNVVMTSFCNDGVSMCLGLSIQENKNQPKNRFVDIMRVPEDLRSRGNRVIGLKGDGNNNKFSNEGKYVFTEFITKRMEIFVSQ
eukprot:55767_1